MGLIYQKQGGYVGHTLNYAGYDCLAINALVKNGAIDALGKPLGIGKEADVLDALTPTGDRVALKFQRLGRISFRQTRRKRDYLAEHSAWIFQSRLAAEKEFEALNLAYDAGVAVPKPIHQNRHVIIMEMIEGTELSKTKELDNPDKILKLILSNVRKAYWKANLVHGDLSDYNIFLKPDNKILIIDWPQAVKTTHASAQQLLTRDVKNITTYFKRKYKTKTKANEALDYVMGKPRKLKSKAE